MPEQFITMLLFSFAHTFSFFLMHTEFWYEKQVLMMSLKAGGVGLNLIAVSNVFYDGNYTASCQSSTS